MNTLTHWHKAQQVWPELLAHKAPTVTLSARLAKTAGLCYVETGEIVLASKFIRQNPDYMMGQILAHETAHYVDFCLYGWQKYKRHHGRLWQQIMHNLGYNPEPYHTMEI